jgi:GxxExxY protein
MPLSIVSTLPEETEVLIERVIGAALEVHRRLGPGFLESIYLRAMCIELAARSIPFECERSITVIYRDTPISGQRVDLIVANALILELKAVSRMDPVFQAKLISYLRTTGIRAGLLINFNLPLLKEGIKRIVV